MNILGSGLTVHRAYTWCNNLMFCLSCGRLYNSLRPKACIIIYINSGQCSKGTNLNTGTQQ